MIDQLEHDTGIPRSKAKVYRYSYFDVDNKTVYILKNTSQILKIKDSDISEISNGAEGILFYTSQSLNIPPNISLKPEETDKLDGEALKDLKEYLLELGRIRTKHKTPPEHNQTLLLCYVVSIMSSDEYEMKPILALIGDRDSAKTSLAKELQAFLFGKYEPVGGMPENEKDFVSKAKDANLITIDNFDTGKKGTNDLMAKTSTGFMHVQRKLYTNSELETTKVHAYQLITTRDPKATRDDVASRTIPINLKPISKSNRKNSHQRKAHIFENRINHLKTIILIIQRMLEGYDSIHTETRLIPIERVAFCLKTEGLELTEIDGLRNTIDTIQGDYAVEGNPLLAILMYATGTEIPEPSQSMSTKDALNGTSFIVTKFEKLEFTMTDLHIELSRISKETNIPYRITSPKSLGKNLAQYKDGLSLYLDIQKKRTKEGIVVSIKKLDTSHEEK